MRRLPTAAVFAKNTFEESSCNTLHKKLEDVIMSELGFFTLKTGTTSFTSREKHSRTTFQTNEDSSPALRKKTILVLIHQYLQGVGYTDTSHSLELESNMNLRQFATCDNIDLNTVFQEFETYYFTKYQRYPKIVKPNKDFHGKSSHWYDIRFSNRMRTVSFPTIESRHRNITPHCCVRKPHKSTNKSMKSKEFASHHHDGDGSTIEANPHHHGLSTQPLHPESRPITTGGAQQKPNTLSKRNSINGGAPSPPEDMYDVNLSRILGRPFPPAARPSAQSEWTDLMDMISKDIYQANPNVKWDDIVGLDEAKRIIHESVVYPIKFPQLFQGILSPWRGLLMYGPPGTGKTLLAKAVATECNTTFFNISASSLVSKWRGESEKLVRVLFEMARAQAPSTIFLDELDALMSHRGISGGSTEHEGSRRMKTELLIQMDGLACSDDLVFVLAASNLPWELDCAMLRRLEKRILVPLPNSEARESMFRQHLPPLVCKAEDYGLELNSELDYNQLAQQSDGYSGSDIRLVCKESAMQKLRQIFTILGNSSEEEENKLKSLSVDAITTENVLQALERTKPSTNHLSKKYLEWQKKFESA